MSSYSKSKLLRRYQRGTCTEQERLIVEYWLAKHSTTELPIDDVTIEKHLNYNKEEINKVVQVAPSIKSSYWMQMAAMLVFTAGLVTLLFLIKHTPAKMQVVAESNKSYIEKQFKNGWWYIHTPRGKSYTDTLSDGSIITMNAGSRIHFPGVFAFNKRSVYLDEGEALFKVAKDKARPFTVYTPGFSTTALGTSFDIRTYAKERKVAISLLHGKILVKDMRKLSAVPEMHVLLPHQQFIAIPNGAKMQPSTFSKEDEITGWQSGMLSFKDADAAEIINTIENRFNINIINRSTKLHWSYTGTFCKETLTEILKTICLTEEINYTMHNQTVTFY